MFSWDYFQWVVMPGLLVQVWADLSPGVFIAENIDHDHLVHIHVSPEQVPMELMRYTHGFPGHLNVILRSDMSNVDTLRSHSQILALSIEPTDNDSLDMLITHV